MDDPGSRVGLTATDGAGRLELRDATALDIGAIREVVRAGWAYAYRGIVPEGAQREFVERAYSDEALRRRMERGVFLVAVAEGGVVGFVDLSPSGPGEVELAALYVLPEHHGRGIGTRLLEGGLARFPDAERCVLGVVAENAGARRFYEARGFWVVGEAVWRFAGGEAVELRMVRELGQPGPPGC